MRSILNLILQHQGKTVVFIIGALVSILITYLVYWISNKNEYFKYVPSLALISISVYKLVGGISRITTEDGISDIWSFGIFFVTGMVSLFFALILGVNKNYEQRLLKYKASRE